MIVNPDASTLLQVPFQPDLAVVMGDCYINGEEVMQSPRAVLRKQIAETKSRGYVFKTGVEAEFFVLEATKKDSALAISDEGDSLGKPCYDAQSMMRRYALLTDIVLTLNKCGFGVYQTDHEDANGQFEINWHYQDCMTTADQHIFFKWAVKTLAERHGFRATFMPKPFGNWSGNGCHIHCSLWAGDKNVFEGADGNISELARHFLGGVLVKAPAYCVITNPAVNSYKRLNSSPTASGYAWSPNRVSWSGNNRSHMVRIPEGDRFELRLADGAVNPYLLQATMLACGLWGMDTKADPSSSYFPSSVNMYEIPDESPELKNIASLPKNLLDATRALEADGDLTAKLGKEFMTAFLKMQKLEWAEFMAHLSSFELERTVNC
mmetsp:Transcript_6749/g.12278  ORF Transcript_6749/g.12278 Transcript_6749/m.12278 type:complete len:379 (+) Transcript_6749:3-1139(+)